jgi:hypothetical protein
MARLYWSLCRLSVPRRISGEAYSGVSPPCRWAVPRRVAQAVDQAEVGDLQMAGDQEQVVGLDVQVLQAVLEVHPVQRLGSLHQVAQQLGARDAFFPPGAVLRQHRLEAAVSQLHDDEQDAVDDLDAVHRQDERVTDRLDTLKRRKLLLRRAAARGAAAHELDGLAEPSGGLALPDLAEAPLPQRLEQPVTRDRLGTTLARERNRLGHDTPHPASNGRPAARVSRGPVRAPAGSAERQTATRVTHGKASVQSAGCIKVENSTGTGRARFPRPR